jgi:predicted Zn-dependent protease
MQRRAGPAPPCALHPHRLFPLLLLAACAATPVGPPDRFVDRQLQHREAQVARGLAGARDPTAERSLQRLACRIAPGQCDGLRVYVVDAAEPKARAWRNGMLLVHGALFDHLDDEAELAFALAHELAHLALLHWERARDGNLEVEADRWAQDRLDALGYRSDAGLTLLRRLAAAGDRPPPLGAARIRALER